MSTSTRAAVPPQAIACQPGVQPAGRRNVGVPVVFFDTTLRDGEQSPGCSLNASEKLEVAHQLVRLGVDVIEAGFPASSPGDFAAVQTIAREVKGAVICGLARCTESDIRTCWDAIKDAARPRIHTFVSTSDIHLTHQMRVSREEVVKITREMVELCVSLCPDVEFSAMDATRSDVGLSGRGAGYRGGGRRDHHQRARHRGLHACPPSTPRSWTSSMRRCPAWTRSC